MRSTRLTPAGSIVLMAIFVILPQLGNARHAVPDEEPVGLYAISPPNVFYHNVGLLELMVTNLSANRIIDLERRKVKWCGSMFGYINRAKSHPGDWQPFPSGLLGPVRLVPMKK